MKLSMVIGSLLISSLALAGPGKPPPQPQTARAQAWGKMMATSTWTSNGYTCFNGIDDIWNIFLPFERVNLEQQCLNRYTGPLAYLQRSCLDGVAQFLLEKTGECANLGDCTDLGTVAAGDVAAEFCAHAKKGRHVPYPQWCQIQAQDTCRANLLLEIDAYIQMGVCGSYTNIGQIPQAKLNETRNKCNSAVNDIMNTPIIFP